MRRLVRQGVWMVVGLALVAGLLLAGDEGVPSTDVSPAADLGQFNPGNIISDAVFFDGNAMNATDVQTFLDLKGRGCKAGSDGTPCLKDYTQATTTRAADAYCTGYAASASETAAAIIAKVARSCGISARVLLVMLQKEQSLVTNTGSSLYARRYREAMGYACPDTAPCDPAYNGFQNQVYSAARRFQVYKASPTSYNYRAGRTNTVLYNPNRACGSSQLYIQNQATAGLYIYTPYQPNAAALAAGYGTGDACSAYGNRNFWLYFTDWFGSTQAPGESAWQPIGALDSTTAVAGDEITVRGWALDPDTRDPIPVHVYVDGAYKGAAMASTNRPDIAAVFSTMGPAHGYDVTVDVTPGRHTVCIYAINVGAPAANPMVGCGTADTRSMPFGNVDAATVVGNQVRLSGWAVDLDSSDPVTVHVYVNGAGPTLGTANISRPDVGAAYPGAGSTRGYDVTAPLAAGDNKVCIYAINVPPPGDNPLLGCRWLRLEVDPRGNVDSATAGKRAIELSGWALDPETPDPLDVHVYVDGAYAGSYPADVSRPDVAAHYPASGDRHGYRMSVPVTPGIRHVCVFAINRGLGDVNPEIGCRDVNVGEAPVGRFDAVTATGFQVRVTGWALDPDSADPVDVRLSVDGRVVSTVSAAGDRPDIAAAFPGAGPLHGLDARITLPAGRHTVCGQAVNTLGGTGDPTISCAVVDVWPGQREPAGQVDFVGQAAGITTVSGWALDPDAPEASIQVHFYVDGAYANELTADSPRPDVGAYFPGAGDAHGYAGYFILPPGQHTVCVFGINRGAGALNPLLGCRTVTVP